MPERSIHISLCYRIDDATLSDDQNAYRARSYEPSMIASKLTDQAVRKPNEKQIYEAINRSQLLRSIVHDCLEGAHVIDIITKLGKFPDMLSTFAQKQVNQCPQTEFEEKCLAELEQWHIAQTEQNGVIDAVVPEPVPIAAASENIDLGQNKNILMNPADFLCDDNPLLFMVFEETFRRSGLIPPEVKESDNIPPEKVLPKTAYEFYCRCVDNS